MNRIIQGLLPPSGWHYKDAQEGYRVPHQGEAANVQDLSDRLQEYRLQNQLPVGDPLGDIEAYICSNFPRNCTPHEQGQEPIQQNASNPSSNRFVDTIALWAKGIYQNQDRRLMPLSEAEQRAQACLRCPLNQPWENDCPNCVLNAQRILAIIRQGKDVGTHRKLHGCRAHGSCTRTSVHIEREFLGPVAEGAPDYCWMR